MKWMEDAAVPNTIDDNEDILALVDQVIGAGWYEEGSAAQHSELRAHARHDPLGKSLVQCQSHRAFSRWIANRWALNSRPGILNFKSGDSEC